MTALEHLQHPKWGAATTKHIYSNQKGAPGLVANRYDQPGKKKVFLPYDVTQDQWKAPQERPIYNLAQIAASPIEQPVFWVEGEKCADALIELGYLASTSFGGSNALGKTNLSPLAGRTVIIWPDHDVAGESYAKQLAEVLLMQHQATPFILRISAEKLQTCSAGIPLDDC